MEYNSIDNLIIFTSNELNTIKSIKVMQYYIKNSVILRFKC